ncbi:hypothetical protein TorRG33x02_057410 [Trema orientale]|uniref:Uncharacterized protein n=1 Tax=Trema orientale TaxID=63057 RepID=A0A2P5FL33_TREOI|nr:hypothetical protein TorRG33x02_057410 [Trema orientale]
MKKEIPSPYIDALSAWMVKENWEVKSVSLRVLASQSWTGLAYEARPTLLVREAMASFLVSCKGPLANASPSNTISAKFAGKEGKLKETELPFVSSNKKKTILMRIGLKVCVWRRCELVLKRAIVNVEEILGG